MGHIYRISVAAAKQGKACIAPDSLPLRQLYGALPTPGGTVLPEEHDPRRNFVALGGDFQYALVDRRRLIKINGDEAVTDYPAFAGLVVGRRFIERLTAETTNVQEHNGTC